MARTPTQPIRTFESDHRDNPNLHNMFVREAYEDLRIVREVLDRLADRSRVSASLMAGTLYKAMQEEIEQDAAFFEAAGLLFAGLEPLPEPFVPG